MKKLVIINLICLLHILVLHGNSSGDVFKQAVGNRAWSWKFDTVIKRVEPLLEERPDSSAVKGQYIDIFRLYDSGRKIKGIRIFSEGNGMPIYSLPNMELKRINVDLEIFDYLMKSIKPIVIRKPVYFGSEQSTGSTPFSPYLLRINEGEGNLVSFFIAPSNVYQNKNLALDDQFGCMAFLSLGMTIGNVINDDISGVVPFIQMQESMHLTDVEVPLLGGYRNLNIEQQEEIAKRIYELQEWQPHKKKPEKQE